MLITVAICFEVHTAFHCWDCGLESLRAHRCLSLVFVLCYVGSCLCDELTARSPVVCMPNCV